jgi:hypothetical protein
MRWPEDADGDALRRFEAGGDDLAAPRPIDFNIDFADWPPSPEALAMLKARYAHLELVEPETDFDGYVLLKLTAPLSYEFVVGVQNEVSDLMAPFGGVCDSWGAANSGAVA